MGGADWLDFDQVVRASQERMAKAQEIRARLSGLAGSAESPDGRVRVRSTAADPLADLQIDPRGMRMGSAELAAAIRHTARAAREDLDRQVAEITAEGYGDDENPIAAIRNSAELTKDIAEIQKTFENTGRDAQKIFDHFRQNLAGPGATARPAQDARRSR